MNPNRIAYIDWAKGVGILLMVYGHTSGVPDVTRMWISAFHMPLFFIIGGFVCTLMINKDAGASSKFQWYAKKRVRQLFVPYIFWGLVACLFFSFMETFAYGFAHGKEKFSHLLWMLITMRETTSMWFIPCYLIAELVAYAMGRKYLAIECVRNKVLFSVASLSLLYAAFRISGFDGYIQRTILSVFYVYMGFLLFWHQIFSKINIFAALIMLIVGTFGAMRNGMVGMVASIYNNHFVFVSVSLLLSLSLITLLQYTERSVGFTAIKKFMSFWGENTIVLLCTNSVLIEIWHLVDHKLWGDYFMTEGYVPRIVLTGLMLCVEYGIICFSRYWCRCLFGK